MATKSRLKIYIPLTIVILVVLTLAIWWYLDYSKYVRTDDAYVSSNVITVSPKVMGRIVKLYVDEGDTVRAGELLAELDSTDLYAQKMQTEAVKSQSQKNETQSVAKLDYDKENQKVLEVNLARAKDDFTRAQTQFDGGVITHEQYDHFKRTYESAQAQLAASQAALVVSQTQIGAAAAGVNVASAQIDVINSQLHNYKLYAPCNGVIAKRWLLPGDIVQPGQSVFTINDYQIFWIQVYLEETKMSTLTNGREAIFTIDSYPDVTFKGKIYDIGSTTAAQFSLIPPNNASGNFTKVTQRILIKISIDSAESNDGRQLSDFPLLTGMSAVVKILKN
ncbi:MAG: HlyD family secretion protein [Paludibacter sp.]|nr:HlyD family secretion protein [Paludibacter sp.]